MLTVLSRLNSGTSSHAEVRSPARIGDSAMRIFLTGATGYIGSAVLDALLRAGHDVTALVRDPEKAERVSRRGVEPIIGELSKPASYAAAAEAATRSCTPRSSLEARAEGRSAGHRHAARRGRTARGGRACRRASSTPPASGCWATTQGQATERRAGRPDAARGLAAGARAARARARRTTASGPSSCGPASCTAARAGSSAIC